MEKIGAKLKEKREELGLSLEDMSIKTKIQPHYLKAIEEGNLDFFKDDLSYLRYYLRFYCQALNMSFEEVRQDFEDEMDKFNETQSIKKIQEIEARQQSINQRIQDSRNQLKPEKRKMDYSLVSLILVIVVVAGAMGVFAFKYLPDFLAKEPDPIVQVTPYPSDEPFVSPEATDEPIVNEKSKLTVTTVDGINYEVTGWKEKEEISIKVLFGADTWMRVAYNDVVSDNPTSKIYKAEEKMEILVTAENDLKITVHFGRTLDNKIYLNDEEYALDERYAKLQRGQQIHFVLKGEVNNEFTE